MTAHAEIHQPTKSGLLSFGYPVESLRQAGYIKKSRFNPIGGFKLWLTKKGEEAVEQLKIEKMMESNKDPG